MPEQTEAGQQQQQQQPLQDVGPLIVSVVAAAAAGALAVLARKALSGGGGDGASSGSGESQSPKDATSFDDVDNVADDLQALVEELRSESRSGSDSKRLTEIMDTIGEYADQAADAFNTGDSNEGEDGEASGRRVTDELMSRIRELTAAKEEKADSGSSGKSTQKAQA